MHDYVEVKYMKLSENAKDPVRATKFASGMDVFAAHDIVIEPWKDGLIDTDLRWEIPPGWDLETKNKSGRATKNKLVKGAQTVDCDYRGNYKVHLFNLSDQSVVIEKGEKVAQVVIRPVWLGMPVEAEISADTERGENGFGSTGIK